MTATTTTSRSGGLRERREHAGLTRAQLAALVGCSITQLANIEQGAIPKRSRVLETAHAVLSDLNDERRPGPTGRRSKISATGGLIDGSCSP